MSHSTNVRQWTQRMNEKEEYNTSGEQQLIAVLPKLCNGTITPHAAAVSIATAFKEQIQHQSIVYWYMWSIYIDAIFSLTTTGDQRNLERLVDTLIELSKLPDVYDRNGQVAKKNGRVFWRDIPEFGFVFYDAYDGTLNSEKRHAHDIVF